MRAPRALRAALAVALGLAPLPASAGVLVGASLTLEVGTMPPTTFVGTGVAGSSTGPLYATLASGSGIAGTVTATIPSSAAPPIDGIFVFAGPNELGVFTGATPGQVGGTMDVGGRLLLTAFAGLPLLDLDLPFGVPVSVIPPVVSGIGITMHGSPWTAGTASIYVLPTATTGTATTTTRMGSNGLNAKGAGSLVLVSAVNVLTNIAGQLPSFATLTLQYVPEPGVLAWVAPGVVGLSLIARRLHVRRADRR